MNCPNCDRRIWQTSWTSIGGTRIPMVVHKDGGDCLLDDDQSKRLTEMLIESCGSCRCGHPRHSGQCSDAEGCWCDTFTRDGVESHPVGPPTLEQYGEWALKRTPDCGFCGGRLEGPIQSYPHPHGWRVRDFEEKRWLYIACPRCDYEWSLWKLGVPREEGTHVYANH